ncbi:MAG: iron-containing alcohol dehydrogenase family protein [Eubacteriales bacterium]|nr:iron-containing alcohol dehydrogenase family protein [Eubacteriales bacterium]
MENYSVLPAPYTVGPEAYKDIPRFCSVYGRTAVVIGGETAISKAKDKLNAAVEGSDLKITDYIVYGKECTRAAAGRSEELSSVREADMIFAVGGGKAVDTCKIIALDLGKPLFTFPTIVSNCAASSALSIVYNDDGSFAEFLHLEGGAKHVFIDTAICAAAPKEYLWAGIGDTYAKYYEVSISAKGEKLPHYLALGVNMSRMCWETLCEHGEQALKDNIAGTASYDFEQAALAIIITTGYVSMLVAKEHNMDYNGGVAHAFFYGLCNLPRFDENHLHGVVVGFGVLVLLTIDGRDDEVRKLIEFNKKVGLPVKLSDIEVTVEDVAKCAEAMTKDEDLEHYPYKVTADMIVEAARKLDY